MAAPGSPTRTFYPYVGWYYYRTGTSAALKVSRAHFWLSWGMFDPASGTFPSTPEGRDGQIFLTVSMQM